MQPPSSAASQPQPPSPLKAWYLAARPQTLSASVAPVLVGSALAWSTGVFSAVLFACALAGSVLIQVGTNLTDEYVDHRKHGGLNKFAAPHKVIYRGLLSEHAVLYGMVVTFGVAIVLGLYIVSQVGWPILAVGLASVAVAYFYSAGPAPLGDIGLGEIAVFIFMGPVMVMATYFVHAEMVTWASFWVSLPIGISVASILHCNNVRDIEEDRKTGKRTLARVLGPKHGRTAYGVYLAAVYSVIIALAATDVVHWLALLSLLTLPIAIGNVRWLWRAKERRDLNMALVRSARLHAWLGYALTAGLLLGGVVNG